MPTSQKYRLSAITLLLWSCIARGQTDPIEQFKQDLTQCLKAQTPAQCRDALPACERAYQVVSAFPAGECKDPLEDRLLWDWASCENQVGQYAPAEAHHRHLLQLRLRRHGPEHVEVAQSLNNLALLYQAQGQLAQAEPLFKRSLAIWEKALGSEHPDVATSLNNLAYVLYHQGKIPEAEKLHRRALALYQKLLGFEHPNVADALRNLAYVLNRQGKFAEAETLHRRALTLRQKLLGPEHPDAATSLTDLAYALNHQGKFAEAETLYREALTLHRKLLGPEHPDIASGLNNLAAVLLMQGKFAEAAMLFGKALALRQKLLGAEHPDVAVSLGNLASTLSSQGQVTEAEALHRKALALHQKLQGQDHPNVALSLGNLAHVLDLQGKFAESETLHRKALALLQKLRGPEHPDVATSLDNLALVLGDQGKYVEAEALCREALTMSQKLQGPEHPHVATSFNNLAALHLVQGQRGQALPLLRQAASIREVQLHATVSETRMQALLDTLRGEEDTIYGLLLGSGLPGVKELALQVALLRKGRVAAAGATANLLLQRARSRPEIEGRFQEWQGLRQQYESLLFGGPGAQSPAAYRQGLQQTKLRAEALEAELAQALPELRALQPPKLEAIIGEVAAKLPKGSALVEVVWFRPYQGVASADGKAWGTPHYVALILFPDRRIEAVDLGPASTVDTLALELQTALAAPGTDPVPVAKRLHSQVMGRLSAKLGKVRDLYLSLDGTLNTIPFDALHDGRDYLLGRYRFHYLTSGRDLLRERSPRVAGAPLLLANPEFGQAAEPEAKEGRSSLYQRVAGLPALPGTLREAEAIAALLGIKPLVGAAAREEAVRGSAAPRILHIATHGLFLADVHLPGPAALTGGVRSVFAREDERSKAVGAAEAERLPGEVGAMNRSALVLADAARGGSAKEAARDGLLTADEARSLDLDGTQLVVLSACETGRGGLSAGQGVYGLRRAFLVAGAETLVTSLWRVNDQATGELMPLYYQKLLDPKKPGDRLGAMVEAMQELRAKAGRSHPYYWAPFPVIGSAGPLRTTAVSR